MKTPYFYGVCFSIAMFILINTTQSQVNLPDYLRKYYQYTDSAEMAIIDSSYAKASVYYVKAFEQNKKPFGIDLYNAGITEALQNKNKESYNYLEQVVAKGYGINNIEQNDAFKTFFKTEYGAKLKTFAKEYKPKFNYRYRAILDSLEEVDQYYANLSVDNMNTKDNEIYMDSLNKTYLNNSIFLEQLIKKYGFPSEFNIGLDSNSLLGGPHYIVLLHSNRSIARQNKLLPIVDFTNQINMAIEKGEIVGSDYFFILDHNNFNGVSFGEVQDSYALYKHYYDRKRRDFREMTEEEKNYLTEVGDSSILMTKWGYYKIDESKAKEITSVLEMYGMGNIDNIRKKVLFKKGNNIFYSKIKGAYNFMSWINEEEYNDVIKDLIPVE